MNIATMAAVIHNSRTVLSVFASKTLALIIRKRIAFGSINVYDCRFATAVEAILTHTIRQRGTQA
jgi:hypothetical protein